TRRPRPSRVAEPAAGLRHAFAGVGPEPAAVGPRSAAPRRRHRLPGRAAHLGPEPALAPARPLRRARRRNRLGWGPLALLPAGLRPAGAAAGPPVPWEVPGDASARLRARAAGLPRPAAAPGRSSSVS